MSEVVNMKDIAVKRLKALKSTILSRAKLSGMLGESFKGKRDTYEVLGYPKTLTFDNFRDKYIRQDIASRIVDAPAKASWSLPPIVRENDDPKDITKFEEEWNEIVKSLKVFHYMERVDRLAGLGRYAVMLIGFGGSGDLERAVSTAKSVNFLSTFSEKTACVQNLVDDLNDPRFGLPKTYTIDLSTELTDTGRTRAVQALNTKIVHWTRMIHVAEDLLEDEIFGRPRLERVYNLLDDLVKIAGGSAETFWQAADRGLHIDLDKDMPFDVDDEAALGDEIEEYYNNLRRWIRTRGATVKSLGSEIGDPRGHFNVNISLISGATGIPQRILLGSERGQLASGQDERAWAERIRERQQSFAEPMILRPFIDRLIEFDLLTEPKEGDYEVVWPDLTTLGETGKSEIAERIAKAVKAIAEQNDKVVTKAEFRERWLGLPAENPDLNDEPDPVPVMIAPPSDSGSGQAVGDDDATAEAEEGREEK